MAGAVAVVADRVGWEERQLLRSAAAGHLNLKWINDESMCLGGDKNSVLQEFDALMVRSRSYTRGGLIAAAAEAEGARVVNSAAAIQLCENKLLLRAALRAGGVPVSDFRLVVSRGDFRQALSEFGVPVVLKPIFGGMGRRVTLIRELELAHSVYDYVEDLGHGFEQACLVEPYFPGGSIRCMVVGRTVIAAAEFAQSDGEWRSNAALGNRSKPLVLDHAAGEIVDAVVNRLGAGIYGIDLFRRRWGYLVNEVNHAPAWRAVAATTGADVAAAIAGYLQELLR